MVFNASAVVWYYNTSSGKFNPPGPIAFDTGSDTVSITSGWPGVFTDKISWQNIVRMTHDEHDLRQTRLLLRKDDGKGTEEILLHFVSPRMAALFRSWVRKYTSTTEFQPAIIGSTNMDETFKAVIAETDDGEEALSHKRGPEVDDTTGNEPNKRQRRSAKPTYTNPTSGHRESSSAVVNSGGKTAETDSSNAKSTRDILDKMCSYRQQIMEVADLQCKTIQQQADKIRELEKSGSPKLAGEKEKNEKLDLEGSLLRHQLEQLHTDNSKWQGSVKELQDENKGLASQYQDAADRQAIMTDLLRHVAGPVLGLDVDVDKCIDLIRGGESRQQAIIRASAAYSSLMRKNKTPLPSRSGG